MFFIQEANRHIPSELLFSFLEHHCFLPLFEVLVIASKRATLECYILILCKTWLFRFIEELATAFPVLDHFCLEIETADFSKSYPGSSPIQLKMELRNRICFFWIVCHMI